MCGLVLMRLIVDSFVRLLDCEEGIVTGAHGIGL